MSIFTSPRVSGRPTSARRLLTVVGMLALISAALAGCAADGAEGATEAAPSATASPTTSPTASASVAVTAGAGVVVDGFVGFDDFPMRFEAPAGFSEASEGVGTRLVSKDGVGAGAVLVGSVNSTAAGDLPADLADFIRTGRPNVRVGEVRTATVGGVPAQSFTLTQAPGTNPSDLWCARDGYCFKLIGNKPMDMTAVRTSEGLVLFFVEYSAEERDTAREAMKHVLATVIWK
ncbi:hypothetical protein GCM10011314_31630 [Knoellia flava]|uniref:Lipoprotein n=1 Tax=Knoellia flava TaxID=913969 RepID=A0A8H9FYI1_9MICO|nr:hypothetical protein GCM10011314_31630 [Knoellia flava]